MTIAQETELPGRLLRALVVDDGAVERLAGKTMLERLGFSVEVAASGEEALQLIARQHLDLVLCDICMPGMSGLALLDASRDCAHAPLFVMSTNYDDPEHVVESMQHGAHGYLTKPLRFDALRDTVRQALARHRQEQERTASAARLAQQDALTGLMNKTAFDRQLQARLQSAPEGSECGAVLLLKVRSLSHINHSRGRAVGDLVLQHAARVLGREIRSSDLLARAGGDLFALYLHQIPHAQFERKSALIVDAAETGKIIAGDEPFSLSLLAGGAIAHGGMALDELLNRADFALHLARERGRNHIRLYSTADDVHKQELAAQLDTLTVVRAALADVSRLQMHYQPIIDLATGRTSHFEALLRVTDDHGRPCNAGELVKTCEIFGLIGILDRAVVRTCLGSMDSLPADAGIAINLSGKSIGDPDLLQLIESELAAHAIDPSRIIFELTETAAFYNLEEVQQFVRRIKQLGCRFALDDFGVGFSSFYYIRELAFDYLKLDGSFIVHLRDRPNDQVFVRAMVEISRVFGLSVIAEWVEDGETVQMLRDLGVSFGQGYHFGKAMPMSQVGSYVARA